jgi:hypothetical protein
MSDDRKRPVWPWIVALLIGLPVLYVASFGPACWLSSQSGCGANIVSIVFQPVFSVWWNGPKPFDRFVAKYATALAADRWTIGESGRYQWDEYR